MAAFIDLTGQRFGRLTVLEFAYKKKNLNFWRCLCDCGEVTDVCVGELRRKEGGTKSCGCLSRETSRAIALANPLKHEPLDLTGQRFWRLTTIKIHDRHKAKVRWECHCDCGKVVIVDTGNLRQGKVKSCGCWKLDSFRERITTHGLSGTPEYHAWHDMHRRCENPGHPQFHYWGGRGITVDPAFAEYPPFLAHIGPKPFPEAQLDRIDNEKGYAPGNIRWVSPKENMANRRNTRWVIPGKLLLSDAYRRITVKRSTIEGRAKRLGIEAEEYIADRLIELGLGDFGGESSDDRREDGADTGHPGGEA